MITCSIHIDLLKIFHEPTFLTSWFTLAIIGLFCLFWVYWILSKLLNSTLNKKILLFNSTVLICLSTTEGMLRISQQAITYTEKLEGHYVFLHHGSCVDSLHVWNPYDTVYLGNGDEYQYPRIMNSWGVSDKEWELDRPKDKIRILCLGDSFTQGDGAPADSTYPVFLEQLLLEDSLNVEVMNAGVCGSDPYFEINLFEQRLAQFEPDIVIFSISRQDFTQDIAIRGGFERFDPETGKKTKFAELIYAYSHLFRLWYIKQGYSELLIKEDKNLEEKLINNYIPEVFNTMSETAQSHPTIDFFVFQYPLKYYFNSNYDDSIDEAIDNVAKDYPQVNYFDLAPCYTFKMQQKGETYEKYYWKIDGHHNSEGYKLKAECVCENLFPHLQ